MKKALTLALFMVGLSLLCSSHEAYCQEETTLRVVDKTSVIWFHNAVTTDVKWLDVALSSGLITKVLILYMHPKDVSYEQDVVRDAIATCREYNIPVIWCRTLFPSDKPVHFTLTDLFNVKLYEEIIGKIRWETQKLGCDYAGIDTEAYGNMPLKHLLKEPLESNDYKKLHNAVKGAVEIAGPLDYVLPAYSHKATHPYNAFVQLGILKIAEHTYYDNAAVINDKRRLYDVMGVYVNTTKENPTDVLKRPFFTVEDIFIGSKYNLPVSGLMLYPQENMIPPVANALKKLSSNPLLKK